MRTGIMTALMLAGVAFAQQPTSQRASPAVAPSADALNPDNLRQSAESIQRMSQVLKDVLSKLEEARNTKDVVKLNCVNEKLTQVKGLLRISEQSDVALQEALSRRDASMAEHEFTKVTIARQKVEQLRGETEECIGQLAFRTDENLTVEVEVPENLYPGDPSIPQASPPVLSKPPPASPTL